MWGVSTQIVYVEYAFLENAILDGLLLFLALRYSGCKRNFLFWIAAALGGVGALVYPLLDFSVLLCGVYKVALGVLLPLLAAWKERAGKTSLCILLFFAFSFFVAGGIFALTSFLPVAEGYFLGKLPLSLLSAGVISSLFLLMDTIKKNGKRREVTDFLVECELASGARVKGFIDTGNRAQRKGVPICFVSPTLFARVHSGQKILRAPIKTVSGGREIPLIKMKNLRIISGGQTHIIRWVYLSPSLALAGREYEMLLGAWACVDTDGSEER